MPKSRIVVYAERLYDGKGKSEGVSIVVEGDTIVEVSSKKYKCDFSGVVTPAFIDPHSHIGMERQGEPVGESEVDDYHDPINPMHNPLDSIYFDDRAFVEAVDFGVLYSCVIPGSGNLVGGRAVTIRNFAENRSHASVDDYGYKMALGHNPRSDTNKSKGRHNTRMGNAALIDTAFSEVLRKEKLARIKKEKALFELQKGGRSESYTSHEAARCKNWIEEEYRLALTNEQRALFEMLNSEKTIKVHVHKEDDALYLIDLKKRYGLNITAEHACSILSIEVFRALLENNIPVVYGPMCSLDYKVELRQASYKNVGSLMASGVQYGLMTDHPVIMAHHLRDSLKYFLIQGLPTEKAIGLVTLENAKILGLDDRLGSVWAGKTASLVVWDRDPLHLGAYPGCVMAEGRVIRRKGEAIPFGSAV